MWWKKCLEAMLLTKNPGVQTAGITQAGKIYEVTLPEQ